ncbi:hypothetical protein BOTNAR_0316g00110 [Botryotinia narcissicola]|uniref:FAD-binding PCMH-type domain-containing protein n=1 Tax=Botryotinia narcissicola TaxID=278944 RepID=A0A4Z1HVB8_9HELO|nr:hypothetical protein BOTNAR_0316g00110 [Botryotinia narcissicola]
MQSLCSLLFCATILSGAWAANSTCKTSPLDLNWPSIEDWQALNTSIGGALIKTSPVASSCYQGNPFNSTTSCQLTIPNWTLSEFHASLPESIGAPLYANNSCLPPGAAGYTQQRGCSVGGLPEYVVNATSEKQVSTALAWASQRNIRIIVKGTGHDLNGRSSGAYALSIWTHNFNSINFDSAWPSPGTNTTADVVIAGSGNNWIRIYTAAEDAGRLVVGGGASTVGLGGYIQGGGYGPTSSHYGLAADQILQVRIVTTNGSIYTANAQQNQDLLWAIRGGGAGQYGVVIEYVLKTHPAPTSAVLGTLTLSANGTYESSIKAAWNALAAAVAGTPDLMDAGLAGDMTVIYGSQSGVMLSATHSLIGYNMTAATMSSLVAPLIAKIRVQGYKTNGSIAIDLSTPTEFANFTSLFHAINPESTTGSAGGGSLMSSRLLGRKQLTDISQDQLVGHLQRALKSQSGSGGLMILGMQGGKGPASVPAEMRGALNPSWRTAYLHAITLGASINTTADPQTSLNSAAKWVNENEETMWHDWAPEMGSYMNEANPFNPDFKKDYYGSSYDRLAAIKKQYDPTESLFVLTGVGSDEWDYNLITGKLCKIH